MKFFEYKSVHQYLDFVLQNNPNASHDEIKEAKDQYWKLYYTHYRKNKRKNRKEFTLGFYSKQLKQIDKKRGVKTVSQFLYETIDKELISDSATSFNTESLSQIHLQLMKLITIIEELLDDTDLDQITNVLERLEHLENSFSQILNP
jgi:hypothetical protein